MGIHTPLPPHRRVAIEAEIAMHLDRVEALIARLDLSEPDSDLEASGDELDASYPEDVFGHLAMLGTAALEDAEDDDPGGGNIEDERQAGDWQGVLATLPRYGSDQSRGPVNVQEANRAHLARLNGLVPNGRGGWRHAS